MYTKIEYIKPKTKPKPNSTIIQLSFRSVLVYFGSVSFLPKVEKTIPNQTISQPKEKRNSYSRILSSGMKDFISVLKSHPLTHLGGKPSFFPSPYALNLWSLPLFSPLLFTVDNQAPLGWLFTVVVATVTSGITISTWWQGSLVHQFFLLHKVLSFAKCCVQYTDYHDGIWEE